MADGNYKAFWNYALENIKEEYKSQNKESDFNLWFNLEYIEDNENIITVAAPSKFMQQQMKTRGCFDEIKKKLLEISGQQNIELNCIVKEKKIVQQSLPLETNSEKNALEKNSENTKSVIKSQTKNNKKYSQLRDDFTFENFVPGENNDFAYKAALTVAKEPGKQQHYNPLLLYGGSGLGKTHLLQSVGNYIYENSEDNLKICFISAEDFTNEFTSSLSSKSVDKFKSKYRNLDILLIDDIHFFQGKKAIQEELFYTFNALRDKNHQMVFTCDRPIKELKDFQDRMQSRLSQGIAIDMTMPNYETRLAILQKKIEIQKKSIPSDVIDFLAKNIESNVRELEGALHQLIAYAEIIQKPLTLEIAQEQLRDILNNNFTDSISIDTIQKVVAEFSDISLKDMKSNNRSKKYVIPRQIAIYLAREMTEYSFMEIGREFGGRNHATIIHAYEKVKEQISQDSSFDARIQTLISQIKDYK